MDGYFNYFKLTSDISLHQCHGKVEKSAGQTMGQNTVKSDLYDFNDFIKMWGWGWWVALFIVEVCRLVSEILKHKLQVAVIVLYCAGIF